MDSEPINNDFRSPNIVVPIPFEEADSEGQIDMVWRMRHIVSGQEGAA